MSSFGGTVKLTGESEYRKALGEISGNLKVLNSEMKVVTSQYDRNDKSVENLSSQNEVLNKKIKEQKDKVDVLTKALQQSQAETGENSDKTKKWQTELNNAQAELNKLNKDLTTNEQIMKQEEEAIRKGYKSFDEMAEAEKNAQKETLSLGDIIKANLISEAIIGGLKALGNGVKAVGGAMKDALTDGAAYADNILTLSAQTGMSTDTLEKYNAVAELADVSMETFTGSMSKNIKAMSEAQKGGAKYVEAYDKLGVKVTDANGKLRDGEAVYWETVDALGKISNETERDALAMELFGKKAQDLNTIIDMGSKGFNDLSQQAVDMGAVLGGEGLQALGALDDQMQIFHSTTGSTGNILASAFAPAMSGAMEGVNGLMGSFNGLIASVIGGDEGGIEDAMVLISEQVTAMIENVSTMMPQLLDIVKNLITTLLQVIADNLPAILEEGAKMLSSLIQGIANTIPKLIPMVMQIIQTLLTTILQNLPQIIKMGIQMLVSLIQGIAQTLPTLIPTIIDAVILCAETLLDNLDLIIDAGIELIFALVDGLLDALPSLIDKMPVIIDKVVQALTKNLPKLIEAGIQLTVKLAAGLIKAIPQLVSKLPQIITSIVNGLKDGLSAIADIGKNMVEGIWEGISGSFEWIKKKIKGWVGDVTSFLKKLFGIKSPSKLFKDEIGTNLALGVGEGFADTMSNVSNDMANAIPTEFDADISTNFNSANGITPMSTFDMMVSAFKQALREVKVVMDDREMGEFVTDTVERVVYA